MTDLELTRLAAQSSAAMAVYTEAWNLAFALRHELSPAGLTQAYARVDVLRSAATELSQRYSAALSRQVAELTGFDAAAYERQQATTGKLQAAA